MPCPKRCLALLSMILPLIGARTVAAQTVPLLRAPRVESRVRIQWDPALQRIVAAVDAGQQFHTLTDAPPFLTDDGVTLTYPWLNPLQTSVSVTPDNGPVRADLVLVRVRALMSFASVWIGPAPPASGVDVPGTESCAALATARADAATLLGSIRVGSGPRTVATLVEGWRQSIDAAFATGRDGAEVMSEAVMAMDSAAGAIDTYLAGVEPALSRLELSDLVAPGTRPSSCDVAAREAYDLVRLANPRMRLAQLENVRAAIRLVRDAVSREYASPTQWRGPEFVLDAAIRPPKRDSILVTLRATHLEVEVDRSSGVVTALDEHRGAETIAIQRFSRFATDFAIATVITSITTPGYGTTTNDAGDTVVGRLPKALASVGPAFFASFVCRCQTGPLVAPMLQVGIATANDKPALLGGGGLRLFGLPKGDIALGGGGMIAWVKDLHTLHVGDPIGGTADIQSDLHYVHRSGYYLALQYKF
jgi:hypothetical protein